MFFDALKAYLMLTREDEEILRDVYSRLERHVPAIIDDFYRQILLHEGTRRILESPAQVERLKGLLHDWLVSLFLGPRDEAYAEKRTRIGLTHVRVGLPQVYVYGAMAHIERWLQRAVAEDLGGSATDCCRVLGAITKVINLDLALIAGSYHEAQKYRDFVESSPDMIHEVDREGRLVMVNRTEEKRLGYPLVELAGTKLEDLVVADDRPALRSHLGRLFEQGEDRCEVRLLTASGRTIDVEILATGVRYPLTGEIIRGRANVRDISERKRAAEALRRERDAAQRYLDIAGAIICVIDCEGRFRLMNRKGCDVLGSTEEEIIGRPVESFFPEGVAADVLARFRKLLAGAPGAHGSMEVPILTRSGEERIIELHSTPLVGEDGRPAGVLSSGIDLTERRRMEKALIEQASLARLGEMAAVVAHEVRNPLAGIGGALQILARRFPPGSSDQAVVEEILSRLGALNETVEDLLLFARPRALRRGPVPLLALFQDTAELLLKDRELEGVAVETRGTEVVVQGDAELLKPAFLNILLNGAQAMGGKGRIAVEVSKENGCGKVAIADSGPGIPAQVRERVFEPFFSTKHRGTGLGLPITRRILTAHGGSIEIECPPAGGTTVVIRLPLEEGRTLKPGEHELQSHEGRFRPGPGEAPGPSTTLEDRPCSA
jgi:PAS domain S-box-containing protein